MQTFAINPLIVFILACAIKQHPFTQYHGAFTIYTAPVASCFPNCVR